MKKNLFLIPLLAAVFFLTSCEKETSDPNYPIVGLWIGTYDVTGGNEAGMGGFYYSFDIRADGTVLVQGLGADGNTYYSSGKWTIQERRFKARITTTNLSQSGAVQDVSAIYDKRQGTLTGTVEYVGSGFFTAAFSLDRIN